MLYDPALVDPSVTQEEIQKALDGAPAPFHDADEQDEAAALAPSLVIVPASREQRCANAKRLRDGHVFVGVGTCLKTVRGPILGLPAVYPTAAIAGDHSRPFHPIANAGSTSVPRAAIGFAWNGGAGHTWLELGGGLVSTTDFHEPGFEGVALRSRMLEWCGATRWGWGESVNGFDVWPAPRKPKPPAWSRDREVTFLRNEAQRQKQDGHPQRADQLSRWADRLAS